MGDSFSKIIALFLAVLLLFIFPIKNEFERQDQTTRMFVLTETTRFADSVRNLGYITPIMYQEYANKLASTNVLYEIKMEHYSKKYDPIYDDAWNFQDNYNVNYSAYYTGDIMETLFPDTNASGQKYKMSKGDYFLVKVKNKNKTMATKIQELLYNADFATERIMVNYGGMIKDEDY